MNKKFGLLLCLLIITSLVGCEIKIPRLSLLPILSSNNNIKRPTYENTNGKEETKKEEESNVVDSIDNIKEIDSAEEITNVEEKEVRLFYFDTVEMRIKYVDKKISIKDNALTTALTKELQTKLSENALVLTDAVGIKAADLDRNTGMLKVIFNDSYVNHMNLGTSTESALLMSLVNTYGYNYNVDKVAIYFGDKLYKGVSGELSEGYYKVNYNLNYNDTSEVNQNTNYKDVRLYLYNGADDNYVYINKTIPVIDNALTIALTKALSEEPTGNFFDYRDEVKVKTAKLENGVLTVDLDKSYYNILSRVGSGSEIGALRSLAYTYAYNYNVNKVIILVDGKPYEGSHVSYDIGQAINVDLSNIKQAN